MTKYRCLFDNPVFGDHAPLVLGWSDQQLAPIADRLRPLLPDRLTEQMVLAVASVARSVVSARKLTGGGVHYPRAKDPYRRPKRYGSGDGRFTWHYITNSTDYLQAAELITQHIGVRGQPGKGYESVAFPAPALVALIAPLIDDSEVGALTGPTESIVLRDARKKLMDYADTAETIRMREELTLLMESLGRLEIRNNGTPVPVPPVRRIFNESFARGGRLYCHGPSHQNMSKAHRRRLEFVIDGVAHPVEEIDYCTLHVAMGYAEAGVPASAGDLYAVDGFDRELVKYAVNALFNAETRRQAVLAVTRALDDATPDGGVSRSVPWFSPRRKVAEDLVAAVEQSHSRIAHFFGSDCGARFQRRDSDMAVRIMLRMTEQTGRCPLPVHDSFVVAEVDAPLLSRTMESVASEQGLAPKLKRIMPSPTDHDPVTPCPRRAPAGRGTS